jgi:WD40 repeat protein
MSSTTRAVVLLALAALVVPAQPSRPILSADDVTSVRSLVGGVAQWFPDGRRILIGGALGGSDLWAVPAGGGFPETMNARLGETAFLQSNQVKFSPDGQWISYLAQGQNSTELFVRSVTEGRVVQVTRLGARINSYAWAPDSRRLALAGDKYGSFDIWIAALDGATARLTND